MEGPIREKKILILSVYRSGTTSLTQALMDLGYKEPFHTKLWAKSFPDKESLRQAVKMLKIFDSMCDACLPVLPTYNAEGCTREQFDAAWGPAEVLADVAAFAEPLLKAYPDAKVILVRRDFDSWRGSYLRSGIDLAESWKGRLCVNIFEPLLGMVTTRTVSKLSMGWAGFSSSKVLHNKKALRQAHDAYHEKIRTLVPPERLLDIDLKDLDWKPLCEFLGKKVPEKQFPHLNDSADYLKDMGHFHILVMVLGTLKLCVPVLLGFAGYWVSSWFVGKGYAFATMGLGDIGSSDADGDNFQKSLVAGGSLMLGTWWAFNRAKF